MIKNVYKKIKEIKYIYIVFSFIAIVVLGAFFFHINQTRAIYGDKVYGYAWSENIGWISFNNCVDPANSATCNGQSYGVTYNSTNGALTGYAWSENIGWIQFGGLSGFPSGSGTTAVNATGTLVAGDIYKLTGWARAISPTYTNDGSCPNSDPDNDGCWDGWISLSGTNSSGTPYSVMFNANTGFADPTNHYAWGSSILGWIDFSQTKITPPITVGSASIDSFSGPDCVLKPPANTTNLSWTTVGMTTCNLWKNGSVLRSVDVNSPTPPSAQTLVTVGSPSSTFFLRCTDSMGYSHSSDSLVIASLASCAPTVTNKQLKIIER